MSITRYNVFQFLGYASIFYDYNSQKSYGNFIYESYNKNINNDFGYLRIILFNKFDITLDIGCYHKTKSIDIHRIITINYQYLKIPNINNITLSDYYWNVLNNEDDKIEELTLLCL